MVTKKAPVKKAAPKKRATVRKTPVKKKAAPRKKLAEKNQHGGRRANSGGARKGSGRPKGAATKKTREIADKLAESDEVSPLEFMLTTMRLTPEKLQAQHKTGELDTEQYVVALQDLQRRREKAAETAAPYIHPRLSSIEANVGLHGQDKFVDLMLAMDKNGSAS